MSKGLVATVVLVVLFVSGGLFGGVVPYFSYKNQAVRIENQATAKQDACMLVQDKMWKIISQKAGVTDKYSQDFKNNFSGIMAARYEGKDPMFNWIKEANPNFSVALYEDLSRSIEAYRNEYASNQTALRDIKTEHDNLRTLFPSSLYLSFAGIKELKVVLVTSGRTKEAYRTGEDNDVELFKK
jgi:hypothetical protein